MKKHSFWEVRNDQNARFSSEALNQEPDISCGEDTPLLHSFLHNNAMAKVENFLDHNTAEQRVRIWKGKRWQQDKAPGEDLDNFLDELSKKSFSLSAEPDNLRWGYSTSRNFNPKEAIILLTETLNVIPKAKWIKIWKGGWWPKVSVFCWLVIKRHILT